MKKLFHILFILAFPILILAQDDIQTVTKDYKETFKYKKNFTVELNGERADVNVQGGDTEEIEITARVVSKNSSKREAEDDIDNMNVILEKIGKVVYARNYISIRANEEKPNSNLKVVFDIKVPKSCNIVINNSFGEVQLSNLNGIINLNTKYSKINLAYIEGQGEVESLLGDINMHSSFGVFNFKLSRADMLLQNSEGYYEIESKYGAIEAMVKPELEVLKITGVSVDVTLMVEDISSSYYNLISTNGKIQVDESLNTEYKLIENDEVQSIEINKGIDCSKLSIDTQYGTISLSKSTL